MKNQAAADSFNTNSVFGINDWVVDQKRSVSGQDLGGGDVLTIGDTTYDIFKIDGSALSLGMGGASATEAGRPTQLSTESYAKQ